MLCFLSYFLKFKYCQYQTIETEKRCMLWLYLANSILIASTQNSSVEHVQQGYTWTLHLSVFWPGKRVGILIMLVSIFVTKSFLIINTKTFYKVNNCIAYRKYTKNTLQINMFQPTPDGLPHQSLCRNKKLMLPRNTSK